MVNIPSSNGSDSNNFIAIIAIFVMIAIMCGIVCFGVGSAVGGGYGYKIGKRKNRSNKGVYEEVDQI